MSSNCSSLPGRALFANSNLTVVVYLVPMHIQVQNRIGSLSIEVDKR
jgi:hypothetical protein